MLDLLVGLVLDLLAEPGDLEYLFLDLLLLLLGDRIVQLGPACQLSSSLGQSLTLK